MSGKRGGRGKALGPAPLPADSLVSFSLPSRRADGGPPARPRHRHHVEHHSEEEYLRAKYTIVPVS